MISKLTDEQIFEISKQLGVFKPLSQDSLRRKFARAIEKKLEELEEERPLDPGFGI